MQRTLSPALTATIDKFLACRAAHSEAKLALGRDVEAHGDNPLKRRHLADLAGQMFCLQANIEAMFRQEFLTP